MKKLYAFHWNYGRMGELDGLFVAEESDLDALVGEELNFGEALGKYSEVCGPLEKTDVEVKSDDQDFIKKLVEIIGRNTISGFNPFDYQADEDDEDE